ncbi:MAG: DASS family sodium-coupled anion symporter [Myxococcales bacterium]|nr:DASS family sodium-coupled anion symporter [Myxococcales bacterium]
MEAASGTRARIGAYLAPLVFALLWLAPLPLSPEQQHLAAIVAAVVVAWTTEVIPIPATAMLIGPLMVACGITDAKSALHPYADPLLFLFYGSFFIAAAMGRHGLDRRMAHAIVRHPLINAVPWRTRAAMMVTGMLLSMWISNTASTAILMPILLGTFGVTSTATAAESDPDDPQARALTGGLLAIAYACSIGGIGTLVGTPPNMITVRLLKEVGVELNFLDWSLIGLPAAVAITALIYLLFARLYPPGAIPQGATQASSSAMARADQPPRGPMGRGERATALTFALAIAGWLIPGALKALDHPLAPALGKALPAGGVAILAASLLFILKDEDRRTTVLPWSEARNIDWGLIMLFGGGISLGTQMFETGLARELGRGVIALTGISDLWALTAIAILFTIFFTEVCSNTATSNMVIPLVIGVTSELGLSPVAPCLGVGLAASCAFMMPIATGPNAIVYGTDRVPLSAMIRVGFILNLLCGVLIFAMLRILLPLYGWID